MVKPYRYSSHDLIYHALGHFWPLPSFKSSTGMFVLTKAIPQPISTHRIWNDHICSRQNSPMGMPNPEWQSGIKATCLNTKGRLERFVACCMVPSSRSPTSLSHTLMGKRFFPLSKMVNKGSSHLPSP